MHSATESVSNILQYRRSVPSSIINIQLLIQLQIMCSLIESVSNIQELITIDNTLSLTICK